MVLPGSFAASICLLVISIICFGLWPNLFKAAGKWRFELFSMDFAIGALLAAVIAAYTLGTLGAELGFSDSMLVAGTRVEATAVVAGGAFAFGNMCYLGTIALVGLANGTLLTFSMFGCALAVMQIMNGRIAMPSAALFLLVVTALLAFASARTRHATPVKARTHKRRTRGPIHNSTKAAILGLLGGFGYLSTVILIGMAQKEELAIGAYGGVLLASIGILLSTLALNFFFLNISLEGGAIGYASFLTGTMREHALGVASGAIWATGALALYTAYTGTAPLTSFLAWVGPFGGCLVAALSGLLIWQKAPRKPGPTRLTFASLVLLVAGVVLLITKIAK